MKGKIVLGNTILYNPKLIVSTTVYRNNDVWHLSVNMGNNDVGANEKFSTEEEARAKQAEIDTVLETLRDEK